MKPWGCVIAAVFTGVILASTAASAQASRYDGNYVGTIELKYDPHNVRVCGSLGEHPFNRPLKISGGSFTVVYNVTRNEVISGPVSSDGTMKGVGTSASGGNSLAGKVAGPEFVGEIGSAYCTYTLRLKKQ